MKHCQLLLPWFLTFLTAALLFSCSPFMEKTTEDDFFEPVSKVKNKKIEEGAQSVLLRNQNGSRACDSTKEEISSILRNQNNQLDEVVQQLNLLKQKELRDTSRTTITPEVPRPAHAELSNEQLLEISRAQDRRMDDVLENIKALSRIYVKSKNRSSTEHGELLSASPTPTTVLISTQYAISSGYGSALQLFKQQKYHQALRSFQRLLRTGVETDLQDNCRFWMGVCYFNLNNIDKAIFEFKNVMNDADSDKSESAFFMIGQCYEKNGAKTDAKNIFEMMLKKYPDGTMKEIATLKLALLK
jgi:TolA-binding protein